MIFNTFQMPLIRASIGKTLFAKILYRPRRYMLKMPLDIKPASDSLLCVPGHSGQNIIHAVRNPKPALPVVLYQSDNYIVVDKGFDVKVNSDEADEVTVASQMSQLFPELIDNSVAHRFRFAHRLDYATTGVLCLALNKKAAARIQNAFARRLVTKHYLALVRGHLTSEQVFIDKPVGRDSNISDRHKMCVYGTPGCEDIKGAKSLLIRLESGTYDGEPATKVLLLPYTGRTHQLRVHCAHIGHIIVGDYTYSNREDTSPFRMMLHSYRLKLPGKEEDLDVFAPDPFNPDQCPLWQTEQVYGTYSSAIEHLHNQAKSTEAKESR